VPPNLAQQHCLHTKQLMVAYVLPHEQVLLHALNVMTPLRQQRHAVAAQQR
jgi:hypothetical protein